MKKTFTLFVLLFCTLSGFAVANESRLSIIYLSNSNYSIMVDGRFQANISNGHEDFFRIVQPGYHSIKVYRQGIGYYNQRLVYQTRIFIRPNLHIDIVVNRFGKALIDERPIGFTDIYGEECDIPFNGQHSGGYRQPMNNRDYESLQQTLRNEAFEDTRLQAARVAISRQCISTSQVKGLMELFSFEQNKLELAKFCYKRTSDPHLYFQLNDAFSFSSSKSELAAFTSEQ
jgi:hypothetical protein